MKWIIENRILGLGVVVEHLLSMHGALGSVPGTTRKQAAVHGCWVLGVTGV